MRLRRPHPLLNPRIMLAIAIGLLLIGWHLLSLGLQDAPRRMPTTLGVMEAFRSDLFQGETDPLLTDATSKLSLIQHSLVTLGHWGLGFLIALLIGLTVGLLTGLSSYASRLLLPVFNFLRSTPSAALYPILILIIGISAKSKLFVISFGAIWPILLSTEAAVRTLHKETYDALRLMPIPGWRRLTLLLKWAAPGIFVGIELAVGIAFLLTVTVEMLGSLGGGLGSYISLSMQRFGGAATDKATAALLLVGLISYLLISGTSIIGRRISNPNVAKSTKQSKIDVDGESRGLSELAAGFDRAHLLRSGRVAFWPRQVQRAFRGHPDSIVQSEYLLESDDNKALIRIWHTNEFSDPAKFIAQVQERHWRVAGQTLTADRHLAKLLGTGDLHEINAAWFASKDGERPAVCQIMQGGRGVKPNRTIPSSGGGADAISDLQDASL